MTITEALTLTRDQWRDLDAGAWLMYDIVLKLGQLYPGRALPRRYVKRMPKACFYNARTLVRNSDTLRYCEGYAMADEFHFLFEHAWAIDRMGRIVDPTLNGPEGYNFFGIVLADEWLQRRAWRYTGVLRDDLGFPRREVYAAIAPDWTRDVFDVHINSKRPWLS
jgi:hypothetical protein